MAQRKVSLNRIIAANVACQMKLLDMKNKDLAKKIGIGHSALSNKMTGKAPWTDENLERISRSLKIPIEQLVTPRNREGSSL